MKAKGIDGLVGTNGVLIALILKIDLSALIGLCGGGLIVCGFSREEP